MIPRLPLAIMGAGLLLSLFADLSATQTTLALSLAAGAALAFLLVGVLIMAREIPPEPALEARSPRSPLPSRVRRAVEGNRLLRLEILNDLDRLTARTPGLSGTRHPSRRPQVLDVAPEEFQRILSEEMERLEEAP